MPILPYRDLTPKIAADVFVAEGAVIVGDVTIGAGSSVWYNVVIRADGLPVVIGCNANVQDGAVVHGDRDAGTVIGDNCTVGHMAVIHGATLEPGSLVGIHAVVMNHSVIGAGSVVGSGAVVTEGQHIPPGSLVLGIPGRVVRQLTPEEAEAPLRAARSYTRHAQVHRARQLGVAPAEES